MEQLMTEIAAFAAARSIKPATVIQNAARLSGKAWAQWEAGGNCTVSTADKIRKYMKAQTKTEATQ